MQYNYNHLLSQKFYNKCIIRNTKKSQILDNYITLNTDIDTKKQMNFCTALTKNSFLSNQNNKSIVLKIFTRNNEVKIQSIKNRFRIKPITNHAFLVKPCQNGFLYYTNKNIGFFSKNFVKAFIIILKKNVTKKTNLTNKIFLCNLHKNQYVIISKLKVLSNKINFLIKFDKKIRRSQVFLNQKYILPIKINYAKDKKTNKSSIKYFKKEKNYKPNTFNYKETKFKGVFSRKNSYKFNTK